MFRSIINVSFFMVVLLIVVTVSIPACVRELRNSTSAKPNWRGKIIVAFEVRGCASDTGCPHYCQAMMTRTFDILPSPSLDQFNLNLNRAISKVDRAVRVVRTTVVTINHDREGSTTRNGARRGAWLH